MELKKTPGKMFAMKCLSKERMRAEGLADAVMEERKVLEAINRLPFVVKFHCAFQSPLNLYLVQEYYAGRNQVVGFSSSHDCRAPDRVLFAGRRGVLSDFEKADVPSRNE